MSAIRGHYVSDPKTGALIWVGPAGEELSALKSRNDDMLVVLEAIAASAAARTRTVEQIGKLAADAVRVARRMG